MDSMCKIYNAKNLNDLAARIREYGCIIAPRIRKIYYDRPEYALEAICQYEEHAKIVLDCESMSEAWRYLRSAGFGDPLPFTNPRLCRVNEENGTH
jgi:hypothetical protein